MRVVCVVMVATGCGFEAPSSPVPIDAAADAALDAWTPSSCPPAYAPITGLTSRYRTDTTAGPAWMHHELCRADGIGTHLAVPDDTAEIVALQNLIAATPGLPVAAGFPGQTFAWIGGVQVSGSTMVGASWLAVTGGPMIATAWEAGEPNDNAGTNNVEDNQEQFAILWKNHTHIADLRGVELLGAVCECDGKPIDTAANDAIEVARDNETD